MPAGSVPSVLSTLGMAAAPSEDEALRGVVNV